MSVILAIQASESKLNGLEIHLHRFAVAVLNSLLCYKASINCQSLQSIYHEESAVFSFV